MILGYSRSLVVNCLCVKTKHKLELLLLSCVIQLANFYGGITVIRIYLFLIFIKECV